MSESSSAPEKGKANLPPPAESSSTPKEQRTALPPPIEIAKIAAILSRGGTLDRKAAVDQAIALALHAGIRYAELVGLTFDQILKEVGDLALLDWFSELKGPPKKLRLYPDNARVDPETQKQFFHDRLDEARSHLRKKAPYLNMLKTRSVLETIELYFLKSARDHNERNADKIKKFDKEVAHLAKEKSRKLGRTVTIDNVRSGMELPKDLLTIDEIQTGMTHPCLSRDGKRECERFMDQAAVRDEGKSEGHHFRPGKVLYWELTENFLDKLIAFRRELKKTRGGIRALRDRLSKASTKKIRNLSRKSDAKRRNLAGKRARPDR